MNAHSFRSMLSRQNAVPFASFFLLIVVAAFGFTAGTAQSPEEEREVVYKIPKHLPIKVKVKKPEKLKPG